MNLRMYLFKHRMTIKEFCELIDYSRNQISGVMLGKYKPSRKLARLIERATNGEVTVEEVMNIQLENNIGDKNE